MRTDTSPATIIRLARVRDLPAVLAMWGSFHRELSRHYVPLVRLTRENQVRVAEHFKYLRRVRQLWLIWRDDVPIGYAAAVANLSPLELPFSSATITDLYVRAGYRGMGCGTRLLNRVVMDIAARGLDAVNLTVAHGNPARELYLAHGFLAWQEMLIKPCTAFANKKLARLMQ